MRSGWLEASGVSIFAYEWGDTGSSPILFWDGIGGTGLRANEIGPVLADEFGHWVIAPDPPGHGRTPAFPPDECRPSRFAALAADLLAELGIRQATFLGFSWGAEIGCWFAARFPELTAALVLVDGGYWDYSDLPAYDTSLDLAGRIAYARDRLRDDVYPDWEAYFAAQAAELGRWTSAVQAGHAATRRRDSTGRIVPVLTAEAQGAIDYGDCLEPVSSIREELGAAPVPVLLLTPSHDPGPTVRRRAIARFEVAVPQADIRELDSPIHDLITARPRDVAVATADWLLSGLSELRALE